MATLFTRIINGELPGRFIWKDEHAVAFLTIEPLKPGHALVVPRAEIDHWVDVPSDLLAHLMFVAQQVAKAQMQIWQPERIGVTVIGLEVPHTHVHLTPIWKMSDMNFANADGQARPEDLDSAADSLRQTLVAAGHQAAQMAD